MGGVSSRRAKDFPLFYIRFTKPKRIRGEGKEKGSLVSKRNISSIR